MQQLYAMRQTDKKVIHIELEETFDPQATKTPVKSKRNFSRTTHNPFVGKSTRNTFYSLSTLNDQNINLGSNIKNAQHTEPNKFGLKKKRRSAQTCYNTFSKSTAYSSIFTQPINKLDKCLERKSHWNTQSSQLYDKISAFNKKLITKQYQLQQKNINTLNKGKSSPTKNYSSIHTQTQKHQTLKPQLFEPRLKLKPWQIKKKGLCLISISNKHKPEYEKSLQRCFIDPWEILDRDDQQY